MSRWDELTESMTIEMGAPLDWSSSAQTTSGADHIKDFIKRIKKNLNLKKHLIKILIIL